MSNLNIYVAGHKGMVGSRLIYKLNKQKNVKIITIEKKDLDLTKQSDVEKFFKKRKIHQVYLAAARVGGIQANNNYPAKFIYENLMIQNNIIHSSFISGVKKLLFLGSSCIYPKNANQPIKEDKLLTGLLEPTNEPYAIAKIAGIKLCESYNRQYGESYGIDYRCVMPTNLYGPGDRYDNEKSHVVPALISRFHEAKIKKLPEVIVWGSGKPKREFLYVDDMIRASIYIMNIEKKKYKKYVKSRCSHINIGNGTELTIKQLAEKLKKIVGYSGNINFDITKPDGNLRKFLNSQILKKIGIKPKVSLEEGLIKTYKDFLKTQCKL